MAIVAAIMLAGCNCGGQGKDKNAGGTASSAGKAQDDKAQRSAQAGKQVLDADEECKHDICKRSYHDPEATYVIIGDTYCPGCAQQGDPIGMHNAWKCEVAKVGSTALKERYINHPLRIPNGFIIEQQTITVYFFDHPNETDDAWMLSRPPAGPVDQDTVCDESPLPSGWHETGQHVYSSRCEFKGTHNDPNTHLPVNNNNARIIERDKPKK